MVATPDNGRLLLLKTDCVVERVHFWPNDKPGRWAGRQWRVLLSDFAAMAGLPQFALVTLVVSADREARWVKQIYRGLHRAADRFAVAIVGGETSRTDGPATISVALIGTVEEDRWVSRAGGKVGDALFVTGKLGGSIDGKHLNFAPRIAGSPLAERKLLRSRDDGLERWARGRSTSAGRGERRWFRD